MYWKNNGLAVTENETRRLRIMFIELTSVIQYLKSNMYGIKIRSGSDFECDTLDSDLRGPFSEDVGLRPTHFVQNEGRVHRMNM